MRLSLSYFVLDPQMLYVSHLQVASFFSRLPVINENPAYTVYVLFLMNCIAFTRINHNYNKILKSDWLSIIDSQSDLRILRIYCTENFENLLYWFQH